jgi:hypothetical protein
MSTFGNNLIEPLSDQVVDVRPQNHLREGSIALPKNVSIGERENGASGEQIVPYVFFARAQWGWPSAIILSTASANLKAMGEIALAAYWQLGKPMFKEVMKEVCHEGTYGFWWKPN